MKRHTKLVKSELWPLEVVFPMNPDTENKVAYRCSSLHLDAIAPSRICRQPARDLDEHHRSSRC